MACARIKITVAGPGLLSLALLLSLSFLCPSRADAQNRLITEAVIEDFDDMLTLNDTGFDDFSGNMGILNHPTIYGQSRLVCETDTNCVLRLAWDFSANPVADANTGLFASLFGLINSVPGVRFDEHFLNLDCVDCPLQEPGGPRRMEAIGLAVRNAGASEVTLRLEIKDVNGGGIFRRFTLAAGASGPIMWQFRESARQAEENKLFRPERAKVFSIVIERRHEVDDVTNPERGALEIDKLWFVPDRPEVEPSGDDELLSLAKRRFCQYVTDWTSRKPESFGITQDRSTFADLLTVGGVGFGLPGALVCAHNEWITRDQAVGYVLPVLELLGDEELVGAEPAGNVGFRGFFYHFFGEDGTRKINFDFPETTSVDESRNTVELSTIDTSLAVMGVLAAQSYFDGASSEERRIRELAQAIYDRVDWPFMLEPQTNQLYLSWKPNETRDPFPEFDRPDADGTGSYSGTVDDPFTLDFYTDETLLAVLLSAGSTTHPLPANIYCTMMRERAPGSDFKGTATWPGALFTYQFFHAFFDSSLFQLPACPEIPADNWFANSQQAIAAAMDFAAENPDGLPTFGRDAWGISAAEGPDDLYRAYGATPIRLNPTPVEDDRDRLDGTVTYYAMASAGGFGESFRDRVVEALRRAWRRGHWHWRFGPPDSFNDDVSRLVLEDFARQRGDLAVEMETTTIDAATCAASDRNKCRSNASGELTRLVMKDETHRVFFDAPIHAGYEFVVRYSNDNSGPLETVGIAVDGKALGTFASSSTGTGGGGWNQFVVTRPLGPMMMTPGRHEFALSVSGGDGYGIELDKLNLTITESMPPRPWVNRALFAIDQGPALLHLENGDTGLIWNLLNLNPNIQRGLQALGAQPLVGTTNSASFSAEAVAPECLVSSFRAGIATENAAATEQPLPTELGGVRIEVIDAAGEIHEARLIFVSPNQANWLFPAQAALGPARVMIHSAGGETLTGSVRVRRVAPGLFSANAQGSGVAAAVVISVQDGVRTDQLAFRAVDGLIEPIPINVVGRDVFVSLFGTCIRGCDATDIKATVGGFDVPVASAGAQPEFAGLDQINIGPLPAELAGAGTVEVEVIVKDTHRSNTVTLTIE